MTTLQEAARKALEALEFDGFTPLDAVHRQHVESAIDDLQAALAQQPSDVEAAVLAERNKWRKYLLDNFGLEME